MQKRALIYHTDLSKDATPDDKDVLKEAGFVSEGMRNLGYEVRQEPFRFNAENYGGSIDLVRRELTEINPLFVFNLVEAVDGTDSLQYIAPDVFEELKIPYTGCTLDAFLKTQMKTDAKELMRKRKIPTPDYVTLRRLNSVKFNGRRFKKLLDDCI